MSDKMNFVPIFRQWNPPHVVSYTQEIRGRPVIIVPGWPMETTIIQYLDNPFGASDLRFLLSPLIATGRTVIVCASGSCWGTENTFPDVGGLGINVIDSAISLATTLGCDTDTIDLIGISHGGVVTLNWAWRNEEKVNKFWLHAPGWDLGSVYDKDSFITGLGLPSIANNMRSVYGSSNKVEFMEDCINQDPHRNLGSIALLSDRIEVVSAINDEVSDYGTLSEDLEDLNIKLTTLSGGGHFFARNAVEWSDLAPLRWFTQP